MDERHPVIKPRRVSFDWSGTPAQWIPGDPVASHVINSVHLMFPSGERWFVQVFKDLLPSITDERLREEVKGFLGQEAVHAYSHEHVLTQVMAREGIETERLTYLPERIVATRPRRRRRMPKALARRILIFEAALIAAIEHYTAALGQFLLDSEGLDQAQADEVMLDLFRWHCAEEVEHRSVAFDTFQHVSGSYPLRVATWILALIGLYIGILGGAVYLQNKDPRITEKATLRSTIRGMRRSAAKGRIPYPGTLLREAPIYLSRDYHPSKTCSSQKALDYLARSPAAQAALKRTA